LIGQLVERGWSRLDAEAAAESVANLYQPNGGVREPWTVEFAEDHYRVARDEDEVSVYDHQSKPRAQDVRDVLNELGV
jgi:hypothetical protein